jgi:dTDP-4-amino-4,6-dideoxygalactose transaminase
MTIPFIDLHAQQTRIKARLDDRIQAVLAHGKYIMGPEVAELEHELARFCGAAFALGCANGTDALQLALMALKAGPGDAIFCPSFTFAATAETVPVTGATPILVDVLPDSFNLDVKSLERAILHARTLGLRPAGVIPVDLFGLPADYDAIEAVARENGMWIVADTAQGFGGVYKGRVTGSIGDIATTSFFPAKPLGCVHVERGIAGAGGFLSCARQGRAQIRQRADRPQFAPRYLAGRHSPRETGHISR